MYVFIFRAFNPLIKNKTKLTVHVWSNRTSYKFRARTKSS